ncbi:MAG: GNAT family N-acetyltransferase [Pirellulales bacterium]|nr:GNAT family N-acetyltransferase [Pirellulales bacterium]
MSHARPSSPDAPMRIVRISDFDELARWADQWDRLAGGAPFRGWTWNATWWRHFGRAKGDQARLFVLLVEDQTGSLVGLAPFYHESTSGQGRVVRLLGSEDACADYLGIPCLPGFEERVAEALASWLTARREGPDADDCWDRIELFDVDAADQVAARLAENLAAQGNTVHERPGPSGWRIELPGIVPEYVAAFSKNARKKFRRVQRNWLDSGRASMQTVQSANELNEALDILIDLHERRRQALGEPGCFASPMFTAFHREVARKMLVQGHLLLHVLRVDGRPIAADYHFAGAGVVYAYQGGVDPERLDFEPGRMITTATLIWAIENGYRAYDLMRGDEPYKMHWQAQQVGNVEYRIVAPHAVAQLRHAAWLAGRGAKDLIRWTLQPLWKR